VTDAFWDRDIRLCSAVSANAIPVAEYALSQILFCLKAGWQFNARTKDVNSHRHNGFRDFITMSAPGGYKSTVGLISLGTIARIVRRFLTMMDIKVIAYDPFTSEEDAQAMDVELCSLEEVFARANVVSIHTPDLPETRGLISGDHLASMQPGASIINTARSAVIRHSEMIEVLEQRPDLWAVLDVTEIATDVEYRRLQELPNVSLTPHIAGSMGPECARMGQFMADELKRFQAGEPLQYEIIREKAAIMA
jgi:phosphoglycerate dehydrogenase-like enzyme